MQLMSMPAVAGISLGVAIATLFSARHRSRPFGEKTLTFLGSFLATLFGLFVLNFGVYYFQPS